MVVEWSGEQQLLFLAQSSVIGCCIGFLFDCFSGYFRGRVFRRQLFVMDAVVGALAALITFFGALVIMDGYLHPLLFAGVGMGFLTEHYVVGRWLSRFLCRIRMWMRRIGGAIFDFLEGLILGFATAMHKRWSEMRMKRKKLKKSQKM